MTREVLGARTNLEVGHSRARHTFQLLLQSAALLIAQVNKPDFSPQPTHSSGAAD